MIEAIAVLAVLIGGCLFVVRAGIGHWALPALGYIAGTCLLIDFGFLQVISGLPTYPILTLSLTVAAPFCWWLSVREGARFPYGTIGIAATLLVVICLVYLFRKAHLVGWDHDTLRYLMSGALIASDNYGFASRELVTKRLLAFPIIHAPANLAGEFYLRSAGPMLAVSGLGLFVWLSFRGLAPHRSSRSVVLTILGVLLLITNSRMVWSAFALFPHLLCALLVLLIAGSGWLMAATGERGENEKIRPFSLVALQSIAIPSLVVARAEGGLLCAIALLPTLLCGEIERKYRVFLLGVFGASLAGWNLFLLASPMAAESDPLYALLPLALVVLSLIAAWALSSRWMGEQVAALEEHRSLTLTAAELVLWIVLGVATIWRPEIVLKSMGATEQNLLYGAGGWGYSLVALALLVLLCAAMARGGDLILLRFPVTSFIPFVFLLAIFREGAYRVGLGDSLNRMWIHIVPLGVLFVVAAGSSGKWRGFQLNVDRSGRASLS